MTQGKPKAVKVWSLTEAGKNLIEFIKEVCLKLQEGSQD